MSVTLPESVDAWRMVAARRSFRGEFPIAAMTRLAGSLADTAGVAHYEMDFGRDEFGTAYLEVHAQAPLNMICQRSLEPFVMPLTVSSKLGLIRAESEESALPPGFESLLVAEDARLNPAEVIEDELIMALPLIPINPDSQPIEPTEVSALITEAETKESHNPFAVLRELKKHSNP